MSTNKRSYLWDKAYFNKDLWRFDRWMVGRIHFWISIRSGIKQLLFSPRRMNGIIFHNTKLTDYCVNVLVYKLLTIIVVIVQVWEVCKKTDLEINKNKSKYCKCEHNTTTNSARESWYYYAACNKSLQHVSKCTWKPHRRIKMRLTMKLEDAYIQEMRVIVIRWEAPIIPITLQNGKNRNT